MNTVVVKLNTPRSCYATRDGARSAARRLFKKGDNIVRVNGELRTWSMDNFVAKTGGGFWGAGWVCCVELPVDGPEQAQAHEMSEHEKQILADAFSQAQAAKLAMEARMRSNAILIGHGFKPF